MSVATFSDYLFTTPENAPTGYTCRRLFIPNDVDWLAIVNGALSTLTIDDAYNAPPGHLSPDNVIPEMLEMIVGSLAECPEEETSVINSAVIYHEELSGVFGGSTVAETWNIRPVNVQSPGSKSIVSVANGLFRPITGHFYYQVTAVAYSSGRHKLRLYDVTADVQVNTGESAPYDGVAMMDGFLTTQGTDWFRIDHYTKSYQGGNGLGAPISDGSPERYMTVRLLQIY